MFKIFVSLTMILTSIQLFSDQTSTQLLSDKKQLKTEDVCIAKQDDVANSNWLDELRALLKVLSKKPEDEREQVLTELNMTEKDFQDLRAYCKLNWMWPGTHKLHFSHSTISLPDEFMMLLGNDVNKALMLGGEPIRNDAEAFVSVTSDNISSILFEYMDNGICFC